MFKKLLFLSATVLTLLPLTARAENRSYYYDNIDTKIIVNNDSTLTVEESQTYNYTGKYTVGWRSIDLNKLGSITDVEVFDGATGQKLTKLSQRPITDSTLPTTRDYGKYATFKSDNHQNIEWYYDMANTQHTWILKYNVHGAIEFGKDADRLYYNIFTDYDVSVKNALVKVIMPTNTGLAGWAYRTQAKKIEQFIDDNKIVFNSTDFQPKEALTVDITFPKNIITKSAFWKDWLSINYGYLGSAIIIVLSILVALIRWIVTEVMPKGRGTIVPQYEPPQNLPPAMAQIIVTERITPKSWISTLIDLAVRGYVKIEEDKKKNIQLNAIFFFFNTILITGILLAIIPSGINSNKTPMIVFIVIFLLFTALIFIKSRKSGKLNLFCQEYVVSKLKPFDDDKTLREYEKKYLEALFASSDTFSTREIKKQRGSSRSTQMQEDMRLAEKLLKDEMDTKTEAFDNKLSKESYIVLVAFILAFVIGSTIAVQDKITELGLPAQAITLISITIACTVALKIFFKFEARLSQKGREMKEEWLGFKMYLEVAEKYRMQNLTPDLFEKYLPYAMIFGVEKKWAKNFEAMHLPPPNWYHSAIVAGSIEGHGSTSTFSPSYFSSSFISSFTSSFSSSGGGGGGGSAGGGGGGGGGGAR